MSDSGVPVRSWRDWADAPLRWAGPLAGLGINQAVAFSSEPDVNLLYAIPVFGLCSVAGVLLADLVVRPRQRGVREAGVVRRRVRDQIPRALAASLGAQAVFLVVLLAVSVATASADEAGRVGRALAGSCQGDAYVVGPWPGPYYAWPVLGGLGAGSVVCALTLRRVTARAGDDGRRRVRARATIGAWGVLVAAPLFAVSSTMAVALYTLPCGGWVIGLGAVSLTIVAFVSAVTAGWCLVAMLVPRAHIEERP
ncbi:hypothetical protein OIE71_23790 [Streptomyces sp. NBC_01725]|uniref:hypothetical protein n=1 Tax=Streptomyces sp. NBC_01725 TaxID=2975923 RepID=UPI002E2C8FD2|nr:hypothetical protein [Streptomyces sp. NBC_01725]